MELWSSRAALKRKAFQGGVLDGPEQAIPHFDRSLLVGDRSSQTSQSRFVIHKASSVGDVNGDGYGDVVLSTDSMAALVFGNALMPVFWEAASVLPVVDQSGSLIEELSPPPSPPAGSMATGKLAPAIATSLASAARTSMATAKSAARSPAAV